MSKRAWIAGLAAAAMIGCGGGSSDEAPAQPAAPQETGGAGSGGGQTGQAGSPAAPGLDQLAQGLQALTQNSATPIELEALQGFLPSPTDWTRTGVKVQRMPLPPHARAEARYTSGDMIVTFNIIDTALNQAITMPFAMFLAAGYEERSEDGYKKSIAIEGEPGFEEWNATGRRGEVTLLVGKRFLIQASGRNIDSLDPVRNLVTSVDRSGLTAAVQ
jgi:hypothetical protein